MDWAKAKSVIIFVFLALNVFLAVSLMNLYAGEGISKEVISDTVKILKSRGVAVKCDIPARTPDVYNLLYENQTLDRPKILKKLLGITGLTTDKIKDGKELSKDGKKLVFPDKNSFIYKNGKPHDKIELLQSEAVVRYVERLMTDLCLNGTRFHLDKYAKKSDGSVSLVLMDKYKDSIIYANRIDADISSSGITYLACTCRKFKISGKSDKKMTAIHHILISSFNTANTTITGIDTGFKGPVPEGGAGSSYESPLWRIRMADGTERYYYAISGEEIK